MGFSANDRPDTGLERLAQQLITLRIFDNGVGRLNRSLQNVQGELLLVPQVTLTASVSKGTRLSFHFVQQVKILYSRV